MTFKINAATVVVAAIAVGTIINLIRFNKMRKQSDEIDRQARAASSMRMDEMRKQMDKDLQSFI